LTAVIGIGDLAILTALYLALESLGYRAWQALFLPLAGLLIGILIGTLIGGVFGIPFMAGSLLVGMWLMRPPEHQRE
jgi:hypothetical protein